MSDLPLLRFIPFRRSDLVQMCLAEERLDTGAKQIFLQVSADISRFYAQDFAQLKQNLKNAYAPLDPDSDTRTAAGVSVSNPPEALAPLIEQVLIRANYDKVTDQALQAAFNAASLFHIRLYVDLDGYAEVVLYTRGASSREEQVPVLFGLWNKTVRFINYDRVVLYLRFADHLDQEGTLGGCRPGSTMLKLFQNVPDADLEMLFPNTRVGMRTLDKLMIGVPALVSGGVVFTTKLGATLVLLGSLFGFWLGLRTEPVELNKAALLVLAAGLGTLGGYLWKQFSSFKTRKLRFTQALTESLYFKLLDNNAGVLYRILDDAEESEVKEAMLAYYFLLVGNAPTSAEELDETIESWFDQHWQCQLDFDVVDALAKLSHLGLAEQLDQHWRLIPQTQGVEE